MLIGDLELLTQERLKEKVEYDAITGVFTWKKGRGPVKSGSVAGRPHVHGYVRITIDYKDYLAHRLAWLYEYGDWPENEIDHINCDKKDNRIVNLREATRAQNCRNTSASSRSILGIKGVSERSDCINRFSAKIYFEGKITCLGQFATEKEAKAAYDKAATELHGDFFRS